MGTTGRLSSLLALAAVAATGAPAFAAQTPGEQPPKPAVRERTAVRPASKRPPVENVRPIERAIAGRARPVAPPILERARPIAPPVLQNPRALEPQRAPVALPRSIERSPMERPHAVNEGPHAVMDGPRVIQPPRPIARPVIVRRVQAPAKINPQSSFVQYYPRSVVDRLPASLPTRFVHQNVLVNRTFVSRSFVRPVQIIRSYSVRPTYFTQSPPMSMGHTPIYALPIFTRIITQYVPVFGNTFAAYAPLLGYGGNNSLGYGFNGYNGNNGYGYNNYGNYNNYGGYGNNNYGNNGNNGYGNNYLPSNYPPYNYPSQNYGLLGQFANFGQGSGFGSFGNSFGNVMLQGVVVADYGSEMVVMTPNLTPVFVNVSPAEQLGYNSGSLAPGSVIEAYGYQSGNQFFATAIN